MRTKNLYRTLYALMALSAIISATFIYFMPDQVPVHFGIAGEVDRVGSRYENLVFPALSIALGALLVFMAKAGDKENERVLMKLAIGAQVCMLAMAVFLFSNALTFDGTAPRDASPNFGLNRITAIGGGALIVAMSNLMPKASMNSTFGLRTPWSKSSEENWRESQRIGAFLGIAVGLAMIMSGFALPSDLATYAFLGLLLAWLGASILASYLVYRRNGVR